MKKIVLMALICIQIFYLCSCGASNDNSESNGNLNAGDNVPDDTTDNNGTDNSTDGGDNSPEEFISSDEIDFNTAIALKMTPIVHPYTDNPDDTIVFIRDNNAWMDNGQTHFDKFNYWYSSFRFSEWITDAVEDAYKNDTELYERLKRIESCRYCYQTGSFFLCRFGDEYYLIKAHFNRTDEGTDAITHIYYGKYDPENKLEPPRSDVIDLNGEMNITADSVYINMFKTDVPTIEVKIVNGELWDNAGERFYGEIKYDEFYFEEIMACLDLKEKIDQIGKSPMVELNLESAFGRTVGVYYSTTELTDSPLGEWCVIVRFDNDLYILPGERSRCCNVFSYYDVYRVNLETNQ